MNENQEVQVRRRRSREEIKRLVVEFETSGVRLLDFCRNHGLAPSTLQRQLKRRRLGNVEAKAGNRLVPVALAGAERNGAARGACALEVVLSSGRRIEVRPDFDSGTLERLLSILERA